MQVADAVDLIGGFQRERESPQVWADLGCGSGVFTKALASILPERSTIYAIDRELQPTLVKQTHRSDITFIEADFEKDHLQLPRLDGILMANSLHYVSDKKTLLERLQIFLAADSLFVIVEYDSMHANRWVPFPIDFSHLEALFLELGYKAIKKLAERKSIYGRGNIYACVASKV